MIRRHPGEDSNTRVLAVNMADTESRRFSKHGQSSNDRCPAEHRGTLNQGDQLMGKHVNISPEEAADRLAIRELVEAYAHCADRRDAKGQMSLFTADTHFVVFMNAKDPTPTQEL